MKAEKQPAQWPFKFAIFACIQFLVLTVIAMLAYPGGSISGSPTSRYSFFSNFFSELGMTVTRSGERNTASMVLFVTALTLAGAGLIVFFVAMPQFFRQKRAVFALSWLGSAFGVVSGAAYIGVAFTPADLLRNLHTDFVLAAFRSFLVVVAVYALVIFLNPRFPNGYAAVYLTFALLLAGYIWLLTQGPDLETERGLVIQATGQKLIVYAAIVCTWIQSRGALRLNQ
ncbi:MAG TPA: hypothetical protein G4O08_03070 [Anaerolineae bacterium]|nr:hypothetical protein [Anaerolineae bacterium]